MFDIGFSELLVIAVVALLVIGPERLPKVARTAGHLFGRLQRYVNEVKADIQREMELDELRKLRSQFQDAARSVEQTVSEVDREVQSVAEGVDRSISSLPASSDSTHASSADASPSDAAGKSETSPARPPDEAKV
jgi:sec-independent protein translocase protein TatB